MKKVFALLAFILIRLKNKHFWQKRRGRRKVSDFNSMSTSKCDSEFKISKHKGFNSLIISVLKCSQANRERTRKLKFFLVSMCFQSPALCKEERKSKYIKVHFRASTLFYHKPTIREFNWNSRFFHSRRKHQWKYLY